VEKEDNVQVHGDETVVRMACARMQFTLADTVSSGLLGGMCRSIDNFLLCHYIVSLLQVKLRWL
jgi:hypothetical protein